MNWNIITDSSCDLLPSSSPDGGIRLTSVPFTIRIGERDFVDDEHLDTMEMLSAMEHERSASHTSCPTPDAWLAQFEQADCAIAITISSQLSGSMNSALAARDMALEKDPDKKIVILDSFSTGPEVLLCVKEIERLIRQGLAFDDIAAHARGFLQKTRILFALSSFDNLIKNGRIHRLTPLRALHNSFRAECRRSVRAACSRRRQDRRGFPSASCRPCSLPVRSPRRTRSL